MEQLMQYFSFLKDPAVQSLGITLATCAAVGYWILKEPKENEPPKMYELEKRVATLEKQKE